MNRIKWPDYCTIKEKKNFIHVTEVLEANEMVLTLRSMRLNIYWQAGVMREYVIRISGRSNKQSELYCKDLQEHFLAVGQGVQPKNPGTEELR